MFNITLNNHYCWFLPICTPSCTFEKYINDWPQSNQQWNIAIDHGMFKMVLNEIFLFTIINLHAFLILDLLSWFGVWFQRELTPTSNLAFDWNIVCALWINTCMFNYLWIKIFSNHNYITIGLYQLHYHMIMYYVKNFHIWKSTSLHWWHLT